MSIQRTQTRYDAWSYQAVGELPPIPLTIRWRVLRHIAAALIAQGWPRLRRWD